jgi:glycerophosphoryl diester phosphodiesterase
VNVLTDLTARPVIGHRGNAAHAPENTLESFAQALALGADALEFDVRLSRDGVPVVVHDASLLRTTGRPELVADLTLADLGDVDAGGTFTPDGGATFPYRGAGLTIPTLAEMLERFASRVPVIIEVKIPEAVEATKSALREAGADDRALIDSTADAAVKPFRGGSLATGASLNDVVRLLPRVLLRGGPSTLPYQALCIPLWYNGVPVPVRQLARVARQARVVTHVWTINAAEVAIRLWNKGVNGIITDDPGLMIAARQRLRSGDRP